MKNKILILLLAFCILASSAGVYGAWNYPSQPITSAPELKPTLDMYAWVDIPVEEVNIVEKFRDILNREDACDITINGTTYTDTYDALIAAFNSSPDNNWGITLHNNSYIGSMQQKGDDVLAVRELFGETLTNEEGSADDYSLMLKREPLDGNNNTGMHYFMDGDHDWVEENKFYPGSEMVLFSTNWQKDRYTPNNYVIVYATVYTRYPKTDSNGNYIYDLDENGKIQYYKYTNQYGRVVTTSYPIYEYGEWVNISGDAALVGYAEVVNYSTGDSSRSFATGTWFSTRDYGSLSGKKLSEMIQANK